MSYATTFNVIVYRAFQVYKAENYTLLDTKKPPRISFSLSP